MIGRIISWVSSPFSPAEAEEEKEEHQEGEEQNEEHKEEEVVRNHFLYHEPLSHHWVVLLLIKNIGSPLKFK